MNQKSARLALLIVLFASISSALAQQSAKPVSLAGEWRFSMDRDDKGMGEKWFGKNLDAHIKLPGILQSQGYGDEITVDTKWIAALPRDMRWYLKPEYEPYTHPGNIKVPYLSQPVRHYIGLAWYQRDIQITPDWQGKNVHLFLERPRWETTVWVDDKEIGTNNSLCAPHEYELGILTPGSHRLTIRCDTRMTVVPGYRPDGHSVSDALGYSWNGIAGKIELSAKSPVWIDDAQAYPDVVKKSALIKVTIGNISGQAGAGKITVGNASTEVKWDEKGGQAEIEVPLGADAKLWDEFHPELQHVTVQLTGGPANDKRAVTFGLREIKTENLKMMLNGHEIYVRGTHSGGDFPLTGYPATDVESWKKIIQLCKDFGLNAFRFHSWCPPDAAFTAADELGFYIQPECGMWNPISANTPMYEMLEKETARIFRAYGNHPSFVMLSASNEPAGGYQQVLPGWAGKWYEIDSRHVIAGWTGWRLPTLPGPQYAITPYRGYQGWFGSDYASSVRSSPIPVLSHEVGQWCAYPDFDVINKFTGYLQGKNYEIYRDSAVAHGVLDQNKEFAFASGKFQLACYKEEVEANFRTPAPASGYQLLDLHDYIGQGGALVGVCDPFWTPKSYVTAELFHRFSGPIVPLARLYTPVMKTSDKFDVDVEIAQFGDGALTGAKPYWKVVDRNGKTAAEGEWPARDIAIGKNIPLGKVELDLTKIAAPMQYKLVVGLQGMKVENDWNFWLYPGQVDTTVPADVTLTSDWNEASTKLAAGGKVLFVPPAASLDNTSPPLNNVPFFWNRLMNPSRTGEAMLGLLCQDKSPALEQFPTQGWCDWNWNELVRGVHAVNIEKAPKELQPIVQAIDDWSRNYKLGVVFECKVGTGRLMVCSIDLSGDLEKRTGARQLRKSLLSYMSKDSFQPTVKMTPAQASALWPGASAPLPAPAPQALPGDIQEGPNAPRPGAR